MMPITIRRAMELPEWEPMDEAELDAIEWEAFFHSSRSKRGATTDPSPSTSTSISTSTHDYGAPQSQPPPYKTLRRLPHWGTPLVAAGEAHRALRSTSLASPPPPPPPLGGIWSLSSPSCRATPKVRYPLLTFGGHIVYSRTAPEVAKATAELLEIIHAKKQNADKISVGFDIEWKPSFKRGEGTRKAAVIQLCADASCCYVMHIIHSGIPPILQAFLEDNSFIKVGVCIVNDAMKIMKDYNVHVEALHDLSGFANLKLGGTPRKWSLCSLTEMLTCKQVAKPNNIRLGNWEVDILSKEQLKYAATDAFASWYLYEALKNFPDATKDENVVHAA